MNSDNYIAILDIGTTKIVAALANVYSSEKERKINIESYGIAKARGMKRGMVTDIGEVTESIREAAQKANFYEKYKISEVYVGISNHTIKSNFITHYKSLPNGFISQKDLDELISEVKHLAISNDELVLHILPHKYIIDKKFEHKNPVTIEGKRLDGKFLVVTADKAFVKSIHQVVKYANLSVKKIIFNPIAASEAVLSEAEKEGGVALIDIGGGTTDLVVVHEKKILYTEVIPFGGENITIDIQKTLHILKAKAEELKVNKAHALAFKYLDNHYIEIQGIHGRLTRSVTARTLSIIAQARLSEIFDTINDRIKSFIENGQIADGYTIVGGSAFMKDIAKFIKYRTNLEAHIETPNLTNIEELNQLNFASTQGLILFVDKIERQKTKAFSEKRRQEINFKEKTSGVFKKLIKAINNFFSDNPQDFTN